VALIQSRKGSFLKKLIMDEELPTTCDEAYVVVSENVAVQKVNEAVSAVSEGFTQQWER
jgi:hypothetical protein